MHADGHGTDFRETIAWKGLGWLEVRLERGAAFGIRFAGIVRAVIIPGVL